jgi:DNA-binding protein H-NS
MMLSSASPTFGKTAMPTFDLSTYNLAELKGLEFDVRQEIKARQQQEVSKAREQILGIARNAGLSDQDLIGGGAPGLPRRPKNGD